MTVNDQQIRAIAFLAKSCRPNGARGWDSAGVMAALRQVTDRSLATVVIATIQAASDRDVDSPAVIPTVGPHWNAAAAVKVTRLDTAPVGTRCTVCGKPPVFHTKTEMLDHTFSTPKPPPEPEEVAARVAALRSELAPTSGPTDRRTLADLAEANPTLHARLERLRAENPGLETPPMREDETPPELAAVPIAHPDATEPDESAEAGA